MKDNASGELILFDNIGSDAAVGHAVSVFSGGQEDDFASYYAVQRAMLPLISNERVIGTYWQNHVALLAGAADNPFSRLAEHGVYAALYGKSGIEAVSQALTTCSESDALLFRLAVNELRFIQEVYAYDFSSVARNRADNIAAAKARPGRTYRRQYLHDALLAEDEWTCAAAVAEYYHGCGAGAFEAFNSYIWEGAFRGVKASDPITFDDLVGYDSQKAMLIENTEFLMRGLPANNVLLYGDSGTGKSSSVKALLNHYKKRGFKLVAIPKPRLAELPQVLDILADRGLKFIVFIDDLSFEENESGYKQFKSVLEGGVSARPDNVVICVTSNRRNIVKEVWKDREGQDDVHLRDNLQEKRSLSDRFGLTIVYSSPDKKEYLDIARALAERAGLTLPENELMSQALTWEIRHGGRSGRTASQFVAHLKGAQALSNQEQES
jgi:predicted AAA+ superfamily ATPase